MNKHPHRRADGIDPVARSRSRRRALQAIYAWQINHADERALIEDARQAVNELDRDGIFTYCISLDPKADEYVSDIFGRQYTVIDRIETLPEKLPELFIALTK